MSEFFFSLILLQSQQLYFFNYKRLSLLQNFVLLFSAPFASSLLGFFVLFLMFLCLENLNSEEFI